MTFDPKKVASLIFSFFWDLEKATAMKLGSFNHTTTTLRRYCRHHITNCCDHIANCQHLIIKC